MSEAKKILFDEEKILQEISQTKDLLSLENLSARYLGKKGLLTEQLKNLKTFLPEERSLHAKGLNQLKKKFEEGVEAQKIHLKQQRVEQRLHQTDMIDVTLPGRGRLPGRLHPITQTKLRLKHYFERLGFMSADGPEVEDDFHNFTALNFPEHHPARASHDTFYFPDGRLLRTHTSTVQIRVLENNPPPVKIIAMGRVYRSDSDLTHTPMFHQIEGLVVNASASFLDLKILITDFLKFFFEKEMPVRFRPAYFPFTEPSAEVDMGCVMCDQKGCRVCKNTGWLEVLGCGMVHPNVLKQVNIDPEKYTGYAFGIGIDRLTMLRHGVNDLRLFFENDLRFLRQF